MTVIDFIYNQKGSQHDLFLMLHNFISEYESVRADIKYKIPFYSITKPVCYVSPQKKGGVELVFWNALKMKNSLPFLDPKKRKWFAGITYKSVEDIDFEVLDGLLQEAIACDSQYNKT
ncbi:MAG: hypothetical protein COA58_12190 [Bacteroidetes bacterium]|nr:MAG: hypothetical protein COA58_12190 [Bacteroidota bacterium]